MPWRPGARRLLTELNELGVPCALVTMSWRRLVDAVVDELAPIHVPGGRHRRRRRGTASRTPSRTCWPPSALGVDPAECVAIEDSPTGVASAGAAGCVVVAVPNIVPIDPAPGRFVVPTLKDVTPRDLGQYLADDAAAAPRRRRRGATPRDDRRRRAAIIGGGVVAALAAVAIGVAALGGGDDAAAAARPAR